MSSSPLQLPLVLWHSAPKHDTITALTLTSTSNKSTTIYTAASSDIYGRIVIWTGNTATSLSPCTLSIGHTCPIVSLHFGLYEWDQNVLLSCDESGTLKLWSAISGHCLVSRPCERIESSSHVAKHAFFFQDQRRALLTRTDGSIEIIDTWDMKTLGYLDHHVGTNELDWNISVIPFKGLQSEPTTNSSSNSNNGNNYNNNNTTHKGNDTNNDTVHIVSSTEVGVVSLWNIDLNTSNGTPKRTRIARSGIRGQNTDGMGPAIEMSCAHTVNGNDLVVVLHEHGCRLLRLQESSSVVVEKEEKKQIKDENNTLPSNNRRGSVSAAAHVFVEYCRVSGPVALNNIASNNVATANTFAAPTRVVWRNHCISKDGNVLYLSDSSGTCSCLHLKDTKDMAQKETQKEILIPTKLFNVQEGETDRTEHLSWRGHDRVPIACIDSFTIVRGLKGALTSWFTQNKESKNNQSPQNIVLFASSFPNTGKNTTSTPTSIPTSTSTSISTATPNKTKCHGGLVLHLELGADVIGSSNICTAPMSVVAHNDGSIEISTLPHDNRPTRVWPFKNKTTTETTTIDVSTKEKFEEEMSSSFITTSMASVRHWQTLHGYFVMTGSSDGGLRVWEVQTTPHRKVCLLETTRNLYCHDDAIIDIVADQPPRKSSNEGNEGNVNTSRMFCTIGKKDRIVNVFRIIDRKKEKRNSNEEEENEDNEENEENEEKEGNHSDTRVEHLWRLARHRTAVTGVRFRSDMHFLFVFCEHGYTTVWNLTTGVLERTVATSQIEKCFKNQVDIEVHPFPASADPQTITYCNSEVTANDVARVLSPVRMRSNGTSSPRNNITSPTMATKKENNSPSGDFERKGKGGTAASNSSPQQRTDRKYHTPNNKNNSTASHNKNNSHRHSIASTMKQNNRPSAVRVRPILEKTRNPMNVLGQQRSTTTTTSSTPIGHCFHVSIPGLVERAEHWLKRIILQKQVSENDTNEGQQRNIYNWSNDRDLSILGYLLCWDLDQDLDVLCTTTLGIHRSGGNNNGKNQKNQKNESDENSGTANDLSFGTYGCDGAMTFVVPTLSTSKERFAVSPELNALHRLGVVTLFMSLMPVVEQLQMRAASGELVTPPSTPRTSFVSSSPRVTSLTQPQDLQHFFSKLITHYGIVFPDMYGDTSLAPSLGMLSYYAVGKWETASVGARLLLQAIIERMEESTRLVLSTRWSNKLHQMRARRLSIKRWRHERKTSTLDGSSTDIEGMEGDGSRSTTPTKQQQLRQQRQQHQQRQQRQQRQQQQQQNDHRKEGTPSKSSTNEMKTMSMSTSSSNSFAIQQAYDNVEEAKFVVVLGMLGVTYPENLAPSAAKVVVSIFLYHIYQRTITFSTVATELIGKGFSLWRPHIPDIPRLLRHLLQIIHSNHRSNNRSIYTKKTNSGGGGGGGGGENTTTAAAAASALASARHALMEAGTTQPLVFMSAVGHEVLRQDMGQHYHKTCLNCIVQLVKNNPLLMVRHLSVVVEAVIRPLYPGEPILRKMCLVASTMALHELVKRFPMVAFHQETQRLACGTLAGRIVLYDLRTATKWRILENNDSQGGISVVTFDADGEILASYSAEDACICTWTAGSGGFLGGILGMQGRRKQKITLNSRGLNDSMMSNVLQHCRLQFSSRQSRAKQLKLRREDNQIVTVGLK